MASGDGYAYLLRGEEGARLAGGLDSRFGLRRMARWT